MNTRTRSRSGRCRTAVIALLLAGILPLAAAGCSSAAPQRAPSAAAAGAGAQWGSCMRDAGFDVQDPDDASVASGAVPVPEGADDAAYTDAAATCSAAAGAPRASTADKQKWERQYTKVASCIRENGFADFPEQQPGVLDFGSYPRSQESGFQQAADTCLQQFAPDTTTKNAG